MSDTRTIPPGPYAVGQRYAEPSCGMGLWDVFQMGEGGIPLRVANFQWERDARLLIYGARLAAALEFELQQHTLGTNAGALDALRAALAAVRGQEGG